MDPDEWDRFQNWPTEFEWEIENQSVKWCVICFFLRGMLDAYVTWLRHASISTYINHHHLDIFSWMNYSSCSHEPHPQKGQRGRWGRVPPSPVVRRFNLLKKGIIKWDPIFWGNQTWCKCMVVFKREFSPKNNALFGLVSYNDPGKTSVDFFHPHFKPRFHGFHGNLSHLPDIQWNPMTVFILPWQVMYILKMIFKQPRPEAPKRFKFYPKWILCARHIC